MLTRLTVVGTLPLEEFLVGLRAWAQRIDPDPGQRTFGNLKRQADGAFATADLVPLVQSSTEDVAGRLDIMAEPKGKNTRVVEKLTGDDYRGVWSSQCSHYHESY